ncbi:hypothetical protein ACF0H5_020350 [Mactra antiquata]
MKIRKGRLRLSPNEEAAILKEETEKRRKQRLQQVRDQSKENAAKIRNAVKQEKHRQLMKLATDIKNQLEAEKAERVRHLEQQYDNSLRNIGVAHKQAAEQPDWTEERELVQEAANLRAEARGRAAVEKLQQEMAHQNHEAHKHIIARKQALEREKTRAAEIAAMPPPPPDPLSTLNVVKPKPVKVTDMNAFSTTHYHLQNEHAVDRAGTEEQINARDAAEIEAERIKERALELKRLREDQLERARLRHNAALEKELLKHDYNNILHDLSDLQRADRDRRLKIVHSIPKQVFEPPNVRMEDREEKQRNLEEEFENMYMAGTHHLGDISMAIDPQPRPLTPTQETSLDVTVTDGTPLQEPTLPLVPPVLRDMTNMPRPKSPGKKPEKVLRNLMDRIKLQREDWMTSQSMVDVGDTTQQNGYHTNIDPSQQIYVNGTQFNPMVPDDSPATVHQELSPSPEKLARVKSPVQQVAPPTQQQVHVDNRKTPMAPEEFAEKLRAVNHRQQTNVQINPEPVQATFIPNDIQQTEIAHILKQQEIIMEQKRQLELKLQQLTYEQQKMQLETKAASAQQPGSIPAQSMPQNITNGMPAQQVHASVPATMQQNGYPQVPITMTSQGQIQPPQGQLNGVPQPTLPPGQQQLANSLSSSGMSQRPMNSIPPTHTTGTAPVTAYSGYQGQPPRSGYQPPSAVLTTDQLLGPLPQSAQPQVNIATSLQNGYQASAPLPMTNGIQGQGHSVSPGHLPPASLTCEGMSEQMRKVREYQQQLLARHEQSKKVLDETKAEIKRRREHLLERYPNLDLSRLEELGAKHLDQHPRVSASLNTSSTSRGQDQSVPISSLLASLAAHPYYASTLSRPDAQQNDPMATNGTVGAVQVENSSTHPEINADTNLRKNKLENIRKSLPFDGDVTLTTPVKVYEAYSRKALDTTSATDITESETSTLTEKGSPALKPAPIPAPRLSQPGFVGNQAMQTTELDTTETEIDTTASVSMMSEPDDVIQQRQDELTRQLLEIQRQKEEIIKIHQQGQKKLLDKEEQLKAKFAMLKPDLNDTAESEKLQQSVTKEDSNFQNGRQLQLNLSTIHEVDTPASTRPSDSGTSDGENVSQRSKKSLEFSQHKTETIPEVPELTGFENVETQMQKSKEKKGPVSAEYSGKNIDDVLERAKRFEAEVLQKLRKQTNAVLFDNEFDDSLEFNVSRPRQQTSANLSTGSLTPSSLSTGPLDETTQSRISDPRSGNGSFQTSSKTWADELSQFKIPPSNQSDLSFKVVTKTSEPVRKQAVDKVQSSSEKSKPAKEGTMFAGDKNRFKVYSEINENEASKSDGSSLENSKLDSTADSFEPDSMNAGAMLEHLKKLQEQIRKGEQEREMLAKKLAEQQTSQVTEQSRDSLSQYSLNSSGNVSRPFMPDNDTNNELSQYSLSDKSTDVSMNNDQPNGSKQTSDIPLCQSAAISQEKPLPVRRSPIGDHARAEPHSGLTNGSGAQDVSTEYSFSMSDTKGQRSTSTPGEERRKSALNGTNRSELPSEITVGRPSETGTTSGLSSYTLPSTTSGLSEYSLPDSSRNTSEFRSMSAEESLECIKKEFDKLGKPVARVKTFAVNRDGDLIPDQSDSDKSSKINDSTGPVELSQYTFSSRQSAQDQTTGGSKLDSQSALSNYSLPGSSIGKVQPQVSEFSNRNSLSSVSTDTNPKSSSFTNVTSEQSLNFTGNTGMSLSQYTLNDTPEDQLDAEQDQNDNNYMNKFASLDHMISESKNIIARHKEIINKNKTEESTSNDVPVTTTVPTPHSTGASWENLDAFHQKPKSPVPADDSSMKETTASLSYQSKDTTGDLTSGNQSSKNEQSSLDYLIEHSSGITEEAQPDLTTMTMGSEISISDAFNKLDDDDDDGDSLKSFEKHEMSESESSHNFDDDSLRETSKSDSLQQIIEARRHNFLVQSEKRAVAAKERALAQFSSNRDDTHQTFRAVPVSIVAEPTLSMSAKVSGPERGKSPTAIHPKGVKSLYEKPSTSFDPKETFQSQDKSKTSAASMSATNKALNRALQPRSGESPWAKDSGTKPPDSGTKPKESSYLSKFASSKFNNEDNKEKRGKLVGEIRQFGGSAGFTSPPTPKKTPPKVAPKPVRSKSVEAPSVKPVNTGLSKTLSSWKKSRTVSVPSKLPEPVPRQEESLKNSVRVLPKEAPPPMTEEERRQRAEDELYEKNIRAYNPRLFRLQYKLDKDDSEETTSPPQADKSRESKKESDDNLRKNRK